MILFAAKRYKNELFFKTWLIFKIDIYHLLSGVSVQNWYRIGGKSLIDKVKTFSTDNVSIIHTMLILLKNEPFFIILKTKMRKTLVVSVITLPSHHFSVKTSFYLMYFMSILNRF